MNLEEWRAARAEGEEAELPSGLTVKLRKVSVMDLAKQGKIPTTLQPQFDKFAKQQQAKMTLADLKEFAPMVELVCRACIVEPEGLDVAELPFTDQIAVFGWANEGANQLQIFRKLKAKPVEPAHNGGGVRAEA